MLKLSSLLLRDLKNVIEFINKNGNDCVFQNDKDGFSPLHWVII